MSQPTITPRSVLAWVNPERIENIRITNCIDDTFQVQIVTPERNLNIGGLSSEESKEWVEFFTQLGDWDVAN